MSRRQRTTITISVRLPIPAGKTQAQTIQLIKDALHNPLHANGYAVAEMLVKLEGKTTVYL